METLSEREVAAAEVNVQANTQAGIVHMLARVSALEQHDSEAERNRTIFAGW